MKTKLLFVFLLQILGGSFLLAKDKEAANVEKTKQAIVSFYKEYMSDSNYLEDCDSLERRFLTQEMYDKMCRSGSFSDYNPLVRGQDTSEEGAQTVSCRHLIGDWYEVSFWYTFLDSAHYTYVPIKASVPQNTKALKISYIVPEWGGREYGDHLLESKDTRVADKKSALEFVESFYRKYVGFYIRMSPSLSQDLLQMRNRYCGEGVLKAFSEARKEYSKDHVYCYDMLIDDADFDMFKKRSLSFRLLNANSVLVSNDMINLKVFVQKEDNHFKIVKVENCKKYESSY